MEHLKKEGIKQMDPQGYKDMNYMVNRYVDKIGSEVFSSHMKSVFIEKLQLD